MRYLRMATSRAAGKLIDKLIETYPEFAEDSEWQRAHFIIQNRLDDLIEEREGTTQYSTGGWFCDECSKIFNMQNGDPCWCPTCKKVRVQYITYALADRLPPYEPMRG